jgi:hypothetical protein
MAITGALLAGLGVLLLVSVVMGNADTGRGVRGIIGAVFLVGGLLLNQLTAPRRR